MAITLSLVPYNQNEVHNLLHCITDETMLLKYEVNCDDSSHMHHTNIVDLIDVCKTSLNS